MIGRIVKSLSNDYTVETQNQKYTCNKANAACCKNNNYNKNKNIRNNADQNLRPTWQI